MGLMSQMRGMERNIVKKYINRKYRKLGKQTTFENQL
jgi:hypothetical protein